METVLPEIKQSEFIYSHYGNNHKRQVPLLEIDVRVKRTGQMRVDAERQRR